MRYCLILLIFFLAGGKVYSQVTDTSDNTIDVNFLNYPNSKKPIENSRPLKCTVFRIKKIDNAYIIDIDTKDKTKYFRYTIISLKSEAQNFEKIKKGRQYEFVLFSYYPFIVIGDPVYTYYTINGIKIGFKGDFKTGEIVTSPNLKGLYYLGIE